MKATKKLMALLLAGVMLLATGCGASYDFSVDKKGNVTLTGTDMYYTESELKTMCTNAKGTVDKDALAQITALAEKTTLHGTEYYHNLPTYYEISEIKNFCLDNTNKVKAVTSVSKTIKINGTTYYYDVASACYTKKEMNELYLKEDGSTDTDAVAAAIASATPVTINSKTYYLVYPEATSDNATVKFLGGYYNASTFELTLPTAVYYAGAMEMDSYAQIFDMTDFADYTYTFPYQVLDANGKISDDGYSVTYDIDDLATECPNGFRIWASFTEDALNATDIKVSNVADGKVYSTNRKVTVTTAGTITSLRVNGKTVGHRTFTLKKNGEYTLYVKLASGKTKTISFQIRHYYKISYNVNKGKKLKTSYKTVRYGNKYGKLATPTRKGYKFLGWYTKKSGGTKVTAKTVCKKKATIYAHWKKK